MDLSTIEINLLIALKEHKGNTITIEHLHACLNFCNYTDLYFALENLSKQELIGISDNDRKWFCLDTNGEKIFKSYYCIYPNGEQAIEKYYNQQNELKEKTKKIKREKLIAIATIIGVPLMIIGIIVDIFS